MARKLKLISRKEIDPDKKSLSFVIHKLLNIALPIGLLLLIRLDLVELSVLIVLFSKWRVFLVRPRHMLANLRTNAVDIVVKLSTLSFMIQSEHLSQQIAWTAWYIVWLVVIKGGSSKYWVTTQAVAGQILGLSAIFSYSNTINDLVLMIVVWFLSLASAKHFFSSYEETMGPVKSQLWALFVVQLAWILNRWILVYIFVPQVIFIVAVVGYCLGSIYDAQKQDKLKSSFVRQQVIMSSLILVLIIFFADWQGSI